MNRNNYIKKHLVNIEQLSYQGGIGMIELPDCGICSVIWTFHDQHVSVSPYFNDAEMPTWNDMCVLKDIFYKDDEETLQIHPKKSEYVNIQENCLHLWGADYYKSAGEKV